MSAFLGLMVSTGETTSLEEHQALREDLRAHVFAQRGEFLKPCLDCFTFE